MDKLKILSIGGLEEKIPEDIREKIDITHWDDSRKSIPNARAADVDAIAVILKFAGREGMGCARDASKRRNGIPILPARTWNYVIAEILNCQKLARWHQSFKEVPDPESEPEVETSELRLVTDNPTDMQVPPKKLWDSYEDMLIQGIHEYLNVGCKYDIGDFLPIIAEHTGLSEGDVKKLLPFLSVSGILENTVGDTWRRPSLDGYIVDLEPAPKPEAPRESQTQKILSLIRGLGEGPYPSKYSIETAMMTHKEFVTVDGNPLTRTRAYHYVLKAIDGGVILRDGELFRVMSDPDVKLTPNALPKPKPAKVEPVAVKVDQGPPGEPALTISDDTKFLRGIVGKIEKPLIQGADPDHTWDVIRGIKYLVPTAPWDKLADNTVMRLLRKKGVAPRTLPKLMFTADEWDALAWDCLKDFKMEIMAPFLKSCYYDEDVKCRTCGDVFRFTKGEKSLYFDRELSPPKYCRPCKQTGLAREYP